MPIAFLIGLAAATWPGPDGADARGIVARLSSPRWDEREEAAKEIELLGEEALPALIEAADSRDLVLRGRAAALIDAVEGRRLARPTLVSLDFRSKPLGQIIAEISRISGVTLILEPENDPRVRGKTVTVQADGPIPLWEALDQLSVAGRLRIDPGLNPMMRQRQIFLNGQGQRRRVLNGSEIVLRASDDATIVAPTSVSGAFRVSLLGLKLNRNRNFVRTPETAGQPEATAQFTAQIQARAEPRLTLASLDEPRLIEATDDRGQSLLGEIPQAPATPPMHAGFDEMARVSPLTLTLRYPESPGKTIASLRGSFRALVVGRRADPLVIPLADAVGKTFSGDPVSVAIHGVRFGPDGRQTTIDLSLSQPMGVGAFQPIHNRSDLRASLRPPPSARGQFEFYDAAGRLCHVVDLGGLNMGYNPGGRTSLSFQTPDGVGPPTEARYFGATWASVEVPFAFRDVPMP